MIVRTFGNKFKFCRLYDDDVFGVLSMRPKSNQKLLNIIGRDFLKKDFFYKRVVKNLKNGLRKIYKYTKLLVWARLDGLTGTCTEEVLFRNFYESRKLNVNLIFYLLKRIKVFFVGKISKTKMVKHGSFLKFNYRIDQGKPKRKKKRLTLFCTRLLMRHRLRFFAGRMPVRQFRAYVKKNRGSKFFGMLFIWFFESRIDTILYRLNLCASSTQCRQFIRHQGVLINNILVTIPSYQVKFCDFVSFVNKRKLFNYLLFKFFKHIVFMSIPQYYEVNFRIMVMRFFLQPQKECVFFPFPVTVGKLGAIGERF